MAARRMKPDVVVILTDGYVGDGWPSREDCGRIRVLAVIVGSSKSVPEHIPFVEITP